MSDLNILDAIIGFKKPASKTADYIVDTYLRNSPVSYRISIENAIAQAIIEAMKLERQHPQAGAEGWVMVPMELMLKMYWGLEETWEDACFSDHTVGEGTKREVRLALNAYKEWKKGAVAPIAQDAKGEKPK